ncbi:uncharacterized protein LOC144473143 isoform X2 [Augochlora pura]
MRERTPSADDTPKRAPPAPPREAASAVVAGSKTSSETAEVFHAAKFSPTTTATPNTAVTTTSSLSSVDARMVASTHNLDDLGVSHPASANGDRQQQQEKHGHTYRSAQTAQDKRSRLSNVINNLRKKVPDPRNGDSVRKEEDDRNSVERNLETLEKYVMTVLNGVIKDEEDSDVGQKKEADKGVEPEKLAEDHEDEDSKGPGAKFEPSKPNESRTETAVFLLEQSEASENVDGGNAGKEPCLEYQKSNEKDESSQQCEDSSSLDAKPSEIEEELKSCKTDSIDNEDACKDNTCSSKETKSEGLEAAKNESHEEEKKENRSLGTIIMERLSDHQVDDKISTDSDKEDPREFVSENVELRNVCRDLLNDLLNGINQLIDENSQEKEDKTPENNSEETRNSRNPDLVMTSLHCSLPLDKVASVLQNCQTNDSAGPQLPLPSSSSSSSSAQGTKSPFKPPSPTVRHLCLYCDRKFLSISLRQRHTERVHQQGGGRRSERNSRRPSQNCQYCSEKCAESLEGLFQHMVGSHGDKYHACVQCSTRYPTREALVCHISENHGGTADRNLQTQEKMKESSLIKELGNQSTRDKPESLNPKERRPEESDHEHRTESILLKPTLPSKDIFSNPGSPEFDSSFYSSVSCNIRENLLHHLDGKLQSSSSTMNTPSMVEPKPQQQPQQQQSFYEHSISQIQLPIDISLTAATPVYSKEYSNEDYENSSEYAQKPGKSNRSHPRRVSFEKYNFPRKYDGKEQWTCSIKDLSKFDISTQLSLRKKQQLLKERVTLSRLRQVPVPEVTDIVQDESLVTRESEDAQELSGDRKSTDEQTSRRDAAKLKDCKTDGCESKPSSSTEFSTEFGSFLRLRKWDEKMSSEAAKLQEVVYAELTGEWSRPRIYICGACASKHVTLREMEEHKASFHPNVWCSHFEFSGDQRELYKYLFLPGKDVPTAKAKSAILDEKVCTKCSRNCNTLPELHRHMLECGGDQAWLLGLFGNGKKKCKWRPFGSRSRRRRQRGMKRNIQNSQTPRVTTPKEKQPTGPRVRPSDRESIQKMLANLPPKRATRKVMQDSALRTQGRLRNVQTRSRPRMVGDNSTASRMSRNKAALKNKLLKNAKSIQRNRCRIDNISAVIESVVRNYNHTEEKKSTEQEKTESTKAEVEKDAKEKKDDEARRETQPELGARTKVMRGPRILNKKRNIKIKQVIKSLEQAKKPGGFKARTKMAVKNPTETKVDTPNEPVKTPKNMKPVPKTSDKDSESEISSPESKPSSTPTKNKLSIQTTPKKKRPVDPVASLNASIKAKSQLRSQDGKFARNPNKSPQKSPEVKSPGRPVTKGKSNEASPETVTRSKLRGVFKSKTNDQLPKRITRLSSDSDKMPTLEPAVQMMSSSEEDVQTLLNDLPILSPVTPASGAEKLLRGKNLISKTGDDKEIPKKDQIAEVEEKKDVGNSSTEEDKDLKQVKTRRQKGDVKNIEKNLENAAKDDSVKEKPNVVKEKMKRKSAPGRIANAEEKKVNAVKTPEETTPKKDPKQKTLETRSNSKAKLDKTIIDPEIKIQNVPFEVKKLIGSSNKDDLLTKLVLTSRVPSSKRCLRQPVSKPKDEPGKSKIQKDSESERMVPDSECISQVSTKKEKPEFRRKSLRKTEKKPEKDKVPSKNDQLDPGEMNKVVNEVKALARGRRNSGGLSNEPKSMSPITSEDLSKVEVESPEVENENTDNKRQTRGSLINATDGDQQQTKETPVESNDMSLKKTTSLGKRRGRIKSSNDPLDKKNIEVSQSRSEETGKNSPTDVESLNKDTEKNEGNADDKIAVSVKDNSTSKNTQEKQEKQESLIKIDQSKFEKEKAHVNVKVISSSVNHLQLETGSSMDSGKENSLETVVTVQKLKVGRPRKSWGHKREKTSKRSLNNVIGILTEGMNIPVESQQSVVLTVQTSVGNTTSEESLQASAQQPEEEVSKLVDVETKEKIETNQDSDKPAEELSTCVDTAEEKSLPSAPKISEKEPTTEVPSTKAQQSEPTSKVNKEPTNDIILDLSRRKQKGKGSFLEKIVSKIAKQKDALLEGEVGSLLDTAADELTSILDEVTPGMAEGAECSADGKNGRAMIQRKIQTVNRTKAINENCLSAPDIKSKDGKLDKQKEMEVVNDVASSEEEVKGESSDEKCCLNKKVESETSMKTLCTESESESLNKGDNNLLESKETVPSDPKTLAEETAPIPNGILSPIPEWISEYTTNILIESCAAKQENKALMKEEEPTLQEPKIDKKSKKRSLEGNSPKKNKRKSIDRADIVERKSINDESHLANIMKLLNRPREVPSTKETINEESRTEKVRVGKRKTLNDNSQDEDLSSVSETSEISTAMDNTDVVKKFKSGTETTVETQAIKVEESKIAADVSNSPVSAEEEVAKATDEEKIQGNVEEKTSVIDEEKSPVIGEEKTPIVGEEKTLVASEEKTPIVDEEKTQINIEPEELSLQHALEMRKSSIERSLEIESVKRFSKRRSLAEEKLNQEEEASSKTVPETVETTRRRSLRSKLNLQSNNEEEMPKENENVVAGNDMVIQTAEETTKNMAEKDDTLVEALPSVATESNIVKDETRPQIIQNHKTAIKGDSGTASELSLKESQKTTDAIPKVLKKRGRKKKVVSEPATIPSHVEETSKVKAQPVDPEPVASNQVPSRKSLRVSRTTEETEDLRNLDNFKVPELTEILQHTKKRTFKRKSTIDEHIETQNNPSLVESEVNNVESHEIDTEKEEEPENLQKDLQEGRKRSKSCNKLLLERSSSSGSIDLSQTNRTRSSKRKQLSSEDLSEQENQNHRPESVDNLSESSCVSESSYFRKKRFSKKKKGFEQSTEDVQTETSVTDSEFTDTQKNTDRRQSLTRRAKKNISFFEDQFDLVDEFDIPMDIQDCLDQEETPKIIPQDLVVKLVPTNDKIDEEVTLSDTNKKNDKEERVIEKEDAAIEKEDATIEKEGAAIEKEEAAIEKEEAAIEKEEAAIEKEEAAIEKEDAAIESAQPEKSAESEKSVVEEKKEEKEDNEEPKDVEKMEVKADDASQTQEDFQTPKKRAAGNFVVVHKKTGEILIVEKRKKLTKEAARFFCDVCATSFTRKSSLKKHNLSQSHLLQIINSKKEKTANESSDEVSSAIWKNEQSSKDESLSDESKTSTNESMNTSQEYSTERKSNSPVPDISEELGSLRRLEDDVHTATVEQELLIDPQMKQRTLEDELLDEEICKITENMSHDEYVLTEHTSPLPECTSTPIKAETKKEDETEKKKKKHEKKKDKGKKKKNLVDENLPSDTSDPEVLLDSESSFIDSSETSIIENQVLQNAEDKHVSTKSVDLIEKEETFKKKQWHADDIFVTGEIRDMETVKLNGQKEAIECSDSQLYDLIEHSAKKTENFLDTDVDNNPTSQNNQSHEPLSLEHTINKCGEEYPKESDSNSNEVETFGETDSSYNPEHHVEKEFIAEIDRSKPEIEQSDASMNVDLFNNLEEVHQANHVKNKMETDQARLNDSFNHQNISLVTENKMKTAPGLQNESTKTSRHSKTKKSKNKKYAEQTDISLDVSPVKKTSKSKVNQNKQLQKEYEKPSEIANNPIVNEESSDCSKILGHHESENEKTESFSCDSQIEKNVIQVSSDTEHKFNEDVLDSSKFYSNVDNLLNKSVEKDHNCNDGDEVKPFQEMDEASLSSLDDKPLSEILLMAEEKLQAEKKQGKVEQPPSFLKNYEELKPEEIIENQDTISENMEADTHVGTPKSIDGEPTNVEVSALEISSENESEVLKPAKDSDKDTDKISSEYENTETIPEVKDTPNDKEPKALSNGRKSNVSERQNSNRKSSKLHKHNSKDVHRKSRNKKISQRSKIVGLTSDSDDSDTEDKIESQNKSKIVTSVFGRVFGGEKTDKVKEVLNDWVSKSEDDSDASRSDSHHNLKIKEGLDNKHEDKNAKRHSVSSSSHTNQKKRTGKKSRKNSSSDKVKDQVTTTEDHEEQRFGKHAKSKNSSNKKKSDTETSNYYFLVLPPTSCRPSKKRAEERISRAFEDDTFDSYGNKVQKNKQKEVNYDLRNQGKDSGVKDNGYGCLNYEDDPSKLEAPEETAEDNRKLNKKRKLSASRKGKSKNDENSWRDSMEKSTEKSTKDSEEEDDCFLKDLSERDTLTNQLSVDLQSSSSCSSLAQSDARNRSPSVDRNSHTTRDSDIDEEEDNEEELGHRRISPLFVCGTPRSSIESSSNSENEEEDEKMAVSEVTGRKRSSSEFSSGKIVIRSPSSTHKTEMVTIAPTDAIEDNALDVPQEIEAAKPRQGKVLNFDEELFVECCSRLKATTENELRGAKKIKLDHNDSYHRKEDQHLGFRGPRDRWRDVESQNSLGSLLESVNQLLGEEMYSARERGYQKRGGRNLRSEHSSRSASPDMSRAENLGYEDSLDVAFEHNNKLRDKIQQRMRESESLIASTFGHKNENEIADGEHSLKNAEQDIMRNSYTHMTGEGPLTVTNLSNGDYSNDLHVRCLQEQNSGKLNLDSPGFKSKMNSALGGLLDKALSNLLHNNGKHDHNGSTPMKVLAELACARAPTSTTGDPTSQEDIQSSIKSSSPTKESNPDAIPLAVTKDLQKKIRNPIKELFERKKEMNERKQQEKSKTEAALRELNVHRQRKTKKTKKHQDFPLIRRNDHGGLVERKKRRDGFERKEEFASDRIKDVYEFDEEESQMETNLGGVMSYRNRPSYEVSCLRTKDIDMAGLMSKTIGDSLENGKTGDALSTRLESMIDRKFKELEKFAPKTKGALKAFQGEEQRQITGPMDEFVERKQQKPKRVVEQNLKHSKLKKRSKNLKKKTRNAWYENDSSDEYRTAVKAEDVGVGISKSQRTCSKGKQNIFAELYTSSESEFDDEGVDYETKKQRKARKVSKKVIDLGNIGQSQEIIEDYHLENENELRDDDRNKNDCDNKKSESEMSDQPLVIDERKDSDEQRISDEETENQYERNFELDDLYREDSSVADSDAEEPMITEVQNVLNEPNEKNLSPEKADDQVEYSREDELIPLEEALDLLDQTDANLKTSYDNLNKEVQPEEQINTVASIEPVDEHFDPVQETADKSSSPEEEQDEEGDDDVLALPEKLSTNEKPQKESENLPLHVFLSRKVQESKKRKEQQLKKIQEEQERILMDFQPTRRQRKCAIGKQGLLAEISSSDEEISLKDSKRSGDKSDHEKQRKQKRESKEKRKERYIEKKHEQMIAKEQKAIEDEILRELGKKKESLTQNTADVTADFDEKNEPRDTELMENKVTQEQARKKKHQAKEKLKRQNKTEDDASVKKNNEELSDVENNCNRSTHAESNQESEDKQESPNKQKKHSKSPMKSKKNSKGETKIATSGKKGKNSTSEKSRSRTDTKGSKDKERRSSSGRRDSDDEELKTTKSWNKVEEGVGVAIGRRKRAAANQLYYWSSSSDEEEILEMVPTVEEEEDDRQEQHGWIVGDSHKRMITMLAMEKQLKEKRRRSEDEFEPGKAKSKKHRNSTS